MDQLLANNKDLGLIVPVAMVGGIVLYNFVIAFVVPDVQAIVFNTWMARRRNIPNWMMIFAVPAFVVSVFFIGSAIVIALDGVNLPFENWLLFLGSLLLFGLFLFVNRNRFHRRATNGTLVYVVTGLSANVNANIQVTGPNGVTFTIDASGQRSTVAGRYTFTCGTVQDNGAKNAQNPPAYVDVFAGQNTATQQFPYA